MKADSVGFNLKTSRIANISIFQSYGVPIPQSCCSPLTSHGSFPFTESFTSEFFRAKRRHRSKNTTTLFVSTRKINFLQKFEKEHVKLNYLLANSLK